MITTMERRADATTGMSRVARLGRGIALVLAVTVAILFVAGATLFVRGDGSLWLPLPLPGIRAGESYAYSAYGSPEAAMHGVSETAVRVKVVATESGRLRACIHIVDDESRAMYLLTGRQQSIRGRRFARAVLADDWVVDLAAWSARCRGAGLRASEVADRLEEFSLGISSRRD